MKRYILLIVVFGVSLVLPNLAASYMCDEDPILVDGQECALMSLTSASTGF